MSPLTLGSSSGKVPTDFTELLDHLGSRPQPAVVHYAAADTRVELSGQVLANWVTKLIGLFNEEYDLTEGDEVLIDAPPHWKAAAASLAAGAMGAEVALGSEGWPEAAVVVTDQPLSWVDSDTLGDAELAALSLGMLDSSFEEATGEEIPAWVLDVSAEVRQHPDQLLMPLPEVPLPAAANTGGEQGPLLLTEWSPESNDRMLGTWAQGGVVVLTDGQPDAELAELIRSNEGV
ncbi:hypothetical protein HGQ17_02790 [Nesterenkonia sp. MY13]|uniref:TIGR03089 family protein n=1 Tax=Nesterenkonia sedimenti TaxID=1463632 RepID=A0A7X8THQ8_9MICC|nr:TIGR03089 family protein [Nesterenkonia sedimenti]NLS08945.1 hypothetical protein [Nesterenkonia sedimenti]